MLGLGIDRHRWPAWMLAGVLMSGCASRTDVARVAVPEPERWRTPAEPAPPVGAVADAPVVVEFEREELTPETLEPDGDPYAAAALDDPRYIAAVSDSRTYYEVGREAFRYGDIEAAREFFDRAVDALCEAVDAGHPQADQLLDSVTGYVAAYEVAWTRYEDYLDAEEADQAYIDTAPIDALRVVELPEIPSAPESPLEEPLGRRGLRLHNDVPLVVNNQVRSMLKAYTGRLKSEIEPAFQRSGRFLPMIHEIFREEGVPLDLAWLSLVESGFKTTAYSRAHAKGLWQFIRSTGRMYGLDVDYWIDERGDPIKATRAAARHLRDLYQTYDDWYLALAAYNAGAGKVNRAIRRVGKKDFWAISRTRYLRRETRNYVPAFLATLLIVQDPKAHGFDFVPELPWAYDTVSVDGPADLSVLARCAGTTVAELKRHNPELRRGMTPGDRPSYDLRIPLGTRAPFELAYAELPKSQRLRFAMHTVKRGETLGRIARRYGVRTDSIVAANGLRSRHRIHVGTQLRIPLTNGSAPIERPAPRTASAGSSKSAYYKVRRGDTLSKIARRHGVSVARLRSWNGLRSDRIVTGQRLRVRSGGTATKRRSVEPSSTGGARASYHRVRRGETLSKIAMRHRVSVSDLKRWNGLRSSRIVVGQKLELGPGGSTSGKTLRHKVRRGETLWEIASRYGVTVAELARWNGRSARGVLQVGQRLKVYVD